MRNATLVPLAAAWLILIVGCGDTRYAPVSGVITFKGKPYAKAYVMFQPLSKDQNPGAGSSGETDDEGRFTLKTPDGTAGALIGKHRVMIGTRYEFLASAPGWDYTKGQPEGIELAEKGVVEKITRDPISEKWRGGVDFDVPSGGTDKADFEVGSR